MSAGLHADPVARSYREAVAEEFRVAMARRGLSQSALARRMGTNQAWVSVRARGEVPINVDDLERISDALALDPLDLLPRRWVKPSPVPPTGSDAAWAPRGSNPQPADYKFHSSRSVVTHRGDVAVPRPLLPRRRGAATEPRKQAA